MKFIIIINLPFIKIIEKLIEIKDPDNSNNSFNLADS